MSRRVGSTSSVVLAFDTSAAACSVALLALETADPVRVLAHRSLASAGAQTRLLLPLFEEVLAEVGSAPSDVEALVVGTGPGTFTGVRIGVASARAAALALGVPVLGVCGLAALAAAALEESALTSDEADMPEVVVPVVDARRGQVFGCVYRRETSEETGSTGATGPTGATEATRATAATGTAEAREVWRRSGSIFATDPEEVPAAVAARVPDVDLDRVLLVGRTDLLPTDVLPAGRARPLLREVDASFLVRGQDELEGAEDGGVEGRRLLSWLRATLGRAWVEGAHRPGDLGTPEAVRPLYVRAPDADLHIKKMKDPWAS